MFYTNINKKRVFLNVYVYIYQSLHPKVTSPQIKKSPRPINKVIK